MWFRPVIRKRFWDAVIIAGVAGFIYGSYGFIEVYGWWKGAIMLPLMAIAGYLAIEVVYPLWFGDD